MCSSDLGAWFSFDGQRVGQGRENAKTFLREHPEVAAVIETKIRENAGLVATEMLEGRADDPGADGEAGAEA